MKRRRLQNVLVVLMICVILITWGGIASAQNSYSGTGNDIILQGFHWNSWQYGTWNIIKDNGLD